MQSSDVRIISTGSAHPFLRWCGGKARSVPALLERIPRSWKEGTAGYHEPFAGGAALFWTLAELYLNQPRRKHAAAFQLNTLSDTNAALITTYTVVRDQVDRLIARLSDPLFTDTEQSYYHIRSTFRLAPPWPVSTDSLSPLDRAAHFIYLNKTCYNGLYRVNKKGEFNVPYDGTPSRIGKRLICDAPNLRACSEVLRRTRPALFQQPFEDVLKVAEKGDLAYFDPPYMPVKTSKENETPSFKNYDERGFSSKDQQRLRDVALELKSKGIHVMLSNADHEDVRALYARRFKIETLEVPRNINSNGDKRGCVKEVIIT